MQEYRWGKFALKDAPRRTKVVYTALLAYLLLGLVTIIAMEALKTGWTPQGAADYYRGNEAQMKFEKTPLEMLEVSHMHLFSVPVVFFILGHAFMMTTLPDKQKYGIVGASVLAVFLSIGSPWLIRFGSGLFGWVKVAADLALAGTLLIMVFYPVYEMWWMKGSRRHPASH